MTTDEMTTDEVIALLKAVKSLGGIHKLSVGDLTVEFRDEPRPTRAPTETPAAKPNPGPLVNHLLALVDRGE